MKPSCDEIRDLIIEKEGKAPLSDIQDQMIQRHLTQCSACRAFRDDVHGVLQNLREMPLPSLPDSFFEEIKKQVIGSLGRDASSPSWARRGFLHRIRERFSGWRTLAPLVTGALGILIGITVTLAWRFGPPLSSQFRLSLAPSVPPLAGSIVPTGKLSSQPLRTGDIEEYLGTDELFDTLETQDPQSLLLQLSGAVPEELLEGEGYETG